MEQHQQYFKRISKQPLYDTKSLNNKLKSYNGKINTDFHGKKSPKKDSFYFWLVEVVFDILCRINNE